MNLAIFDLDNTLLKGDSDYNWALFLIKKGLLDKKAFEKKNEQFFQDYQEGNLDVHEYCGFQFGVLKNNDRELMENLRDQYIDEIILPMIPSAAHKLVQSHKDKGDRLLIITATNSFITKPIGKLFGIPDLIGTDPEEIDGKFSGKIAGTPSFQEGKIKRLEEWLDLQGLTLKSFEKTYFYSDSRNDIPLLERVTHPVAANPDEVLIKKATLHAWPIIHLWQ
ncbi:HAD-IB family hydrolase [Methylophilaceae bacterium]|nr:HAD-IB family hydrolase [Methylophilaceae bacterium]MDC1113962.1 HAD-IB family hydrolase [Methylophilaceae bacterium]